MTQRVNKIYFGLLSGLVGIIVGFFALGLAWSISKNDSISYFIDNIALKSLLYRDSILTICTLFNIGIFYLALRKEMWKFCRGLMFIILLSVILIIWFQIQAGIA
tara:strand:+ start:228 stop:542 length:315 start_codon:yes stop_codon:yes gene_type:complete